MVLSIIIVEWDDQIKFNGDVDGKDVNDVTIKGLLWFVIKYGHGH